MQLEIDFDLPEVQDDSIPARFSRFHAVNPQVYDSLVVLARQFRQRQPDAKLGIAMLYEVLRWNYYMATNSEEPYKLSNDFRACYARLIMEQENDLEGIFQTKKSVADENSNY
jgi:hypothetical protein